MENDAIIYGKNAIIEALESGERTFNKIFISNTSHSDVKIEKIKELAGRTTPRSYCTNCSSKIC